MINIVVPFDDKSPDGPPFNSDNYKKGYIELSQKAKKLNMNIYFSRGKDAHLGRGVFNNCYEFIGSDINFVGKIKANVVFDKSKYLKPDGSYPCINDLNIKNICTDKVLTAKKFPSLSPEYKVINSNTELEQNLQEIHGKVVLKPIDGSAGEGVVIEDAKNINIKSINSYPIIMQQFIDTIKGISGIVKSYHDLRVCILDGRIIYSFVRTPGEGDFRAGLATGGTLTVIDSNKIPREVLEMVTTVDETFKNYGHRLYTVDVAFDGVRFWLIELNSQPGLTSEELYPEYSTKYQTELLKLLNTMARID